MRAIVMHPALNPMTDDLSSDSAATLPLEWLRLPRAVREKHERQLVVAVLRFAMSYGGVHFEATYKDAGGANDVAASIGADLDGVRVRGRLTSPHISHLFDSTMRSLVVWSEDSRVVVEVGDNPIDTLVYVRDADLPAILDILAASRVWESERGNLVRAYGIRVAYIGGFALSLLIPAVIASSLVDGVARYFLALFLMLLTLPVAIWINEWVSKKL